MCMIMTEYKTENYARAITVSSKTTKAPSPTFLSFLPSRLSFSSSFGIEWNTPYVRGRVGRIGWEDKEMDEDSNKTAREKSLVIPIKRKKKSLAMWRESSQLVWWRDSSQSAYAHGLQLSFCNDRIAWPSGVMRSGLACKIRIIKIKLSSPSSKWMGINTVVCKHYPQRNTHPTQITTKPLL